MLCNVESTWHQEGATGCNALSDVVVCTVTGSNEALSCRPAAGGVTLLRPDGENPSPCTLKFSVNTQAVERVLISSVDVLCDAKNAEIFGEHEEYIITCRGTRVDDELDLDRKLFIMQHSFDASTTRCSVRLLSLTEPSRLWLHSIYVNLERSPATTNTLTSPSMELLSPSIDLEKVKVMLTDLDQDIPNNAKSLLAAMETFQKHRQHSLASTMATQVECHSSNIPMQMSALMSMFTSMQVATPSTSGSRLEDSQVRSMRHQSDSHPTEICKDLCDKRKLEGTHSKPSAVETSETNCETKVLGNSFCENATKCAKCGDTGKEGIDGGSFARGNFLDLLPVLEKQILLALQESESRILKKVQERMNFMEERINSKLDMILSRLPVQGISSQGDSLSKSACHGDSSKPETGEHSVSPAKS